LTACERPAGRAEPMSAADKTDRPPDRRKLIAVVYADMVGYSRLIGFDDAGTIERLGRLRKDLIDPAIAEHVSRIALFDGAESTVFDGLPTSASRLL
jgi:class 3 adenylate cyclase